MQKHYSIQHQEEVMNDLNKLFSGNDEIIEIFKSMTKEQLCAVSELLNKKQEVFFHIEDIISGNRNGEKFSFVSKVRKFKFSYINTDREGNLVVSLSEAKSNDEELD